MSRMLNLVYRILITGWMAPYVTNAISIEKQLQSELEMLGNIRCSNP